MVKALVQMDAEGGRLPIWPNPAETNIMIASHADCVIADAFVKGLRGYDIEKAYAAVRKDAMVPPPFDTTTRWADRARWLGPAAPHGGAGFEARVSPTTRRSATSATTRPTSRSPAGSSSGLTTTAWRRWRRSCGRETCMCS